MSEETGFIEQRFLAPDGLSLSASIYGAENTGTLPVVCLPGLTRNARDFHELAPYLSSEASRPRKVVSFDYRGRGRSDHDPDWTNYDVRVEAADVAAGLVALDIQRAAFIGTSRGGLIVFALAAMRPGAIGAVVLNDIGPVIEGAGLAGIRAYLENAPKPASFEEAAQVLKLAHGAAFPALGDADWLRMARAIHREEAGRAVPDYDPNLLKTMRKIDFNSPLPTFWPQFLALGEVDVLAIRGANSMLLSTATLDEMARRHPRLETLTVEGQGHAPLLETGDLPARIARFLERAEGS